MKFYEDIKRRAQKADPELQMLLNEATLGRNVVEMNQSGVKGDIQIATVPVMVDGRVIFRHVIYEKSIEDNRPILAEVASGVVYSDKYLVVSDDSPFLALAKKVKKSDKADEE